MNQPKMHVSHVIEWNILESVEIETHKVKYNGDRIAGHLKSLFASAGHSPACKAVVSI